MPTIQPGINLRNGSYQLEQYVDSYWDGTLLTAANAQDYKGALYEWTNYQKMIYRGKPNVFALSSIFPKVGSNLSNATFLQRLVRDYNGSPVLLVVDVTVHAEVPVALPASFGLLFISAATLVNVDYQPEQVVNSLRDYNVLLNKPFAVGNFAGVPFLSPNQEAIYHNNKSGASGILLDANNSTAEYFVGILTPEYGNSKSGVLITTAHHGFGSYQRMRLLTSSSHNRNYPAVTILNGFDASAVKVGVKNDNPTEALDVGGKVKAVEFIGDVIRIATEATAPTPVAGSNDTHIATTAFVKAAIAALVGGSPALLDTLKEFADALGNDANYAATTAAAIGAKQEKLTSGTNIKTVNGQSLLGAGNINVEADNSSGIRVVSADTTLTNADEIVVVDTSAAGVTITLPNVTERLAGGKTKPLIIKQKSAANNLTVTTETGQRIDEGVTSISMPNNQRSVLRLCADPGDDTNWLVL